LLQFFETLHAVPNRVWWQGVSMANAGQAEKRLERILAGRGANRMGIKKSVAVIIVALAIPLVFLAAAARPAPMEQSPTQAGSAPNQVSPAPAGTHLEPPPPSETPNTPSLPPAPEEGVSNFGPEPAPPVAPAMPVGPIGPGPVRGPIGVGPNGQNQRHNRRSWYSYGFDDDQRFVIVTGNSDSLTMSGSSEDAHHVEKLRKQIPGDFIWFQRDEKSYIIRDQATIDRARKLWSPQEELGKKQEELGRQQEALGKQQEELGARMEQVKIDVPDMTAELDRLKAKLQKLGPKATMEQIGELQSEIGELQSKIGELQSHAGDQQGKLGQEMGALGEKQGKLGEQQGKLGQQQAEIAEKATKEMKVLLDEAIKNGTAKPEPGETGGASL
jgi:bla regulator protein blaR1